jgi:hypothetical protein
MSQENLPPQQTTTKEDTPTASSSFVATTSFVSSSYSSTPTPTSTSSIGDGGGGSNGGGLGGGQSSDNPIPKNASYFFGFLVTFVILLLTFVGCGFGPRMARRNGASRFQFGNEDDETGGQPAGGGRRRRKIGVGDKPVLWDVWVAEQKRAAELSWSGSDRGVSAMMMPVIVPGSSAGEQLGWYGIEVSAGLADRPVSCFLRLDLI